MKGDRQLEAEIEALVERLKHEDLSSGNPEWLKPELLAITAARAARLRIELGIEGSFEFYGDKVRRTYELHRPKNRLKDVQAPKPEPPRFAEFLAVVFTKKRYREALLGDLDDQFQKDLANGMTLRRARVRYRGAVLNSIGPQLWAAAKRIGLIGILADYARRMLH